MAISITDKLNNTVNLSFSPKRIVSLVPSQTELLYSLGLNEEVVGITKFCIHPQEWFRSKQRVGGTKTVKTDVVKTLQPDLIIANKEENVKEQIEELQLIAPVWVSDINTLEDALGMITSIGKLVDAQDRANELALQIQEAFSQITPVNEKILTAYLIWKDPYMAAGGDTFIHDMLSRCGLTNIFENINRYPEVSISTSPANNIQESIINPQSSICDPQLSVGSQLSSLRNCQLLLLSSEPYPFKKQHLDELQILLPFTKIMLVDGEMFSWYGSRLLYSAQYFKNLIQQIQQ
ncbi:MAG TPA: helical backbone metal receptor [Segetibacter sp.]